MRYIVQISGEAGNANFSCTMHDAKRLFGLTSGADYAVTVFDAKTDQQIKAWASGREFFPKYAENAAILANAAEQAHA